MNQKVSNEISLRTMSLYLKWSIRQSLNQDLTSWWSGEWNYYHNPQRPKRLIHPQYPQEPLRISRNPNLSQEVLSRAVTMYRASPSHFYLVCPFFFFAPSSFYCFCSCRFIGRVSSVPEQNFYIWIYLDLHFHLNSFFNLNFIINSRLQWR